MKRSLIIMLVFAFVAIAANAQRGRIKTFPVDTLKGDNNQTLATVQSSGSYNSAVLEITCDAVSAQAGGTLYIKGGLEDPQVLNESNSNVKFSTNDTLTITDGVVWRVSIPDAPDYKYQVFGDGDANDTVQITTKVLFK